MENASRALIIAGGILIALVIISMIVILFNNIGDMYSAEGDALTIEQIEEYNRRFAAYNNVNGLYGSELLSLANLLDEYNTRLLDSVGGDENDQFYEDNKLEIDIYIYQIIVSEEIKDEFGKIIRRIYKSNGLRGVYDIKEIQDYNDRLVEMSANSSSEISSDAKSHLTELRSLPFRCYPDMTSINDYGIITYMYFKQEVDQDILNSMGR